MKKELTLIISFALLVLIFNLNIVYSDPTQNTSNITAEGGNVTFIYLDTSGQTGDQVWQGYFGTVTSGIALENAAGDVFYDWNVVDAVGEVIASRSVISDWSLINCSNQTHIYDEETKLDIPDSLSNGINDTYTTTSHPDFYIGANLLTGCRSTQTNNQSGDRSVFWNVILNLNSSETVYAAIMDDNVVGFNGSIVDFQLLVPVNRTSGQSLYNIYVELT
ncbi:hypothetical protein HN789_05880 [archaeon]|jgi:hypothetical protein|nr:hypothetical protein [archaeon]MBT4022303.1 hypothetical protein [archaeon]MBT4271740.1 hypothetical protein [archaeon]MBT4461384.1 hypothetical protein [archaeon]MBT4858639.1 hypothetical protein [archaeon]